MQWCQTVTSFTLYRFEWMKDLDFRLKFECKNASELTNIRSLFQQQRYHVRLTPFGGDVQWTDIVFSCKVNVSPLLNQ